MDSLTCERPVAWIGYGTTPDGEFGIKVCPYCPGYHQAKQDAKPLPVIESICPPHFQSQQERRNP